MQHLRLYRVLKREKIEKFLNGSCPRTNFNGKGTRFDPARSEGLLKQLTESDIKTKLDEELIEHFGTASSKSGELNQRWIISLRYGP